MPSDKDSEDDTQLRLPSSRIYELIAREGREELARPYASLCWSAFVAGICITFSLFCEAFFRLHAPEGVDFFLVENLGYTVGFLIVVLGRFQLFTENTITVILPLLEKFSMACLVQITKLWAVVLGFNMVGTFIVAALVTVFPIYNAAQFQTFLDVSHHAIDREMIDIFFAAMPAGFLIAAMVWMLPSSENAKAFIVIIMTYLIAVGDFAHVVAGSAEAFLLMLNGEAGLAKGFGYLAMAGLGNIIGGTGLFALMAYAQVRDEMK